MTALEEKVYSVYLDWTFEETPRAFYVGKGQERRVDNLDGRNPFHQNVAAKYGQHREVLLSTKDEEFAYDTEVELIALHHTYIHDPKYTFGCNLTKGGEGRVAKGFRQSDEVIAGIREKLTGRHRDPQEYAHLVGVPRSPEVCAAISAAQIGIPKTPEHRANISKGTIEAMQSPEVRERISVAKTGVKLQVGAKRFRNISRNWFLFGRRTAKDPKYLVPKNPRK
jgi:hypothetical protein